jgi:hypothetical protein
MRKLYRKNRLKGTVDSLLSTLSSIKKGLNEVHLYVISSCAACKHLLRNSKQKQDGLGAKNKYRKHNKYLMELNNKK